MSGRLRSSTRASTAASEFLADVDLKPVKGDSRKTNSPKPLKPNELARLRKIALLAFAASFIFMGTIYYAALNDKIQLYPSTVKAEALKGYTSRAEFALRYQTLQVAWLVINIYLVIYGRISTKAINPLVESTEKHVAAIKSILTNSYEQIVLSILLQLAFVSFADPTLTLKLIPAINIVQFLGRIAFFVGYPMYRTFGFNLSLSTNLGMIAYNSYRFGQYVQFY